MFILYCILVLLWAMCSNILIYWCLVLNIVFSYYFKNVFHHPCTILVLVLKIVFGYYFEECVPTSMYYIGVWSSVLYLVLFWRMCSDILILNCSLSPLLCVLYIRGIAHLLTLMITGLSLHLGWLITTDNIVVVARTEGDLKRVLNMHQVECE